MRRALWLLAPLASFACSHGTGHPVHQADGGYSLDCKGPLSDCLHHAERLCKDDGYVVAEARDVRHVMGHEAGQSQVVLQSSDAIVYCGTSTPHAALRLQREPETVVSGPAAAAPPAPPRACVPGATQACIGPAGCGGGQVCATDGTHFEHCDCGPAASTGVGPTNAATNAVP